ncbi:MFS transporter [Micromonospora sp. NPDC048898]|uniref:MFS transporter n=1 Tax=Micromonospora sp. NPDC048898 TaxID=3364260 RepID=UPI00371156B0
MTLITLCAAQFMVALDFSIVTVALPVIGQDLNFVTAGDLQWVMTAFILPTAGFLLLAGRASDLFGRRRLFLTGLVIITGFSLVAGLATEPWMLIAARAGQGIGSAMVGPTALALLTSSFPEGPRRNKALGLSGALLSLGFVLGTIGGGLITGGISWRWTMLLLVLMGCAVLVGALALLPRSENRRATTLDVPGALLATLGLLTLVFAISVGGENGWTSTPTVVTVAAAIVLLVSFLLVEARQPAPLAPLPVLNRRTVKWGGLTGFITFGMCGGTTVLLSLYMQDVLLWTPMTTGFGFLPEGIAAMVAGSLASRVVGRLDTTGTLVTGLVVQGLSTAAMLALPVEGNLVLFVASTAGLGFGHVLAVVAFIGTMTSGLGEHEQGLGGGLAQTAQHVGSGVGVAILAAVVTARNEQLATAGQQPALTALHAGFLVAAVVTVAGAVVAALFLRRPARRPVTAGTPA